MRYSTKYLAIVTALVLARHACPDQASREDLQAAYLYRFMEFIEFPSSTNVGVPGLSLCVEGDDKLATALQTLVHGKSISGRLVTVTEARNARDPKSCQLLYATGRKVIVSSLFSAVRVDPVLTITDLPDLPAGAAVIVLRMKNDRLQFAIDLESAKRRGLSISSRLIQLSRSFQ